MAPARCTIEVWEAFAGHELLTLIFPEAGVPRAAFSPDASRLAAASTSGGLARVHLLRLEDLVMLARARLTRSWMFDECQRVLHVDRCPG
jgi:hypothetical protein